MKRTNSGLYDSIKKKFRMLLIFIFSSTMGSLFAFIKFDKINYYGVKLKDGILLGVIVGCGTWIFYIIICLIYKYSRINN